jgi:hypothetical protein
VRTCAVGSQALQLGQVNVEQAEMALHAAKYVAVSPQAGALLSAQPVVPSHSRSSVEQAPEVWQALAATYWRVAEPSQS